MNIPRSILGRTSARGIAMALLVGTISWSVACYPDEATSVVEYDTVSTLRNDDFNFGTVVRFAMPDTILDLSDEAENPIEITDEYDDLIIAKVRENLLALGWLESDEETDPAPEVVMILGKVAQENISGGVWYPGYPGWGWWYPPCFGCGGYYPPVLVTYTWNTGTVVMTLFDAESIGDGDTDVDAVWLGGLNGVLSSSANAGARLTQGIDQAFTQSPYLSGSGS